ncbi:hypothetical protein BH11ARM2_BH11ARM2_34870 [soil metagenome]
MAVKPIELPKSEDRPEIPIRLTSWDFDDLTLRMKTPLALMPALDESGELLTLDYPPLGIRAYSENREELLPEAWTQIRMLWREYAQERDARLAPKPHRLKRALLEAIEEERR